MHQGKNLFAYFRRSFKSNCDLALLLILGCCRVQRRKQADDIGEEASNSMLSLGLNQEQATELCLEQGARSTGLVQACPGHRNNGANFLFIGES